MSNKTADYLLLMLDRVQEPIFFPKGEQKVLFEIPVEYLTEKYQPIAQKIFNQFGEQSKLSVPIKPISIPNLNVPMQVSRSENFSLFIPKHQKSSDALVEIFMGMRTPDDLLSLAAYCRDRLNLGLFVYAFSQVLLNRPDTRHLQIPLLTDVFPSLFLENKIFSRAREDAAVAPPGSRTPIEIPLEFTGSRDNPEQRVAFFREDVGVNLHHWHWHLIYPFSGPDSVVKKDRRGELFYYMHHQVMARYNTERLANRLGLAKPFDNFRAPIAEAYFPKLDHTVAGQTWPARSADMRPSDIRRTSDELTLSISTLELWRSRLNEAIRTGSMRNSQGRLVPLNATTGINILGNAVESNVTSINQSYYGSLHNSGHVLISYIHDPQGLYLESFAVMATTTTSMRDPVFYRWHGYIDNLFYSFIDTLPPYTPRELNFPGIVITNVSVNTPRENQNTLSTHWNKSDINLTNGLDFVPRGAVLARIQHLNHVRYTYNISVNNTSNREVEGTVRIFVAPRFYEDGRTAIPFNEQRKLMIEMDKFTTRLRRGQNGIIRKSADSHVTIPYETTFRSSNQTANNAELLYCGCGWPQHMLVPRGTLQGFPMDLFVMITDYTLDKIDQPDPTGCGSGITYCGLRDLKYPDRRAMGFPFDRKAPRNVQRLSDFLTPNMRQQQITVRFTDTIKAREPTPTTASSDPSRNTTEPSTSDSDNKNPTEE